MNWNKIKTVLIALFLLIDLFLVIWNINLRREGNVVNDNTISNAVELLSDRGIKIPDGIIDEKIPEAERIVVSNVLSDEAVFIGKILGKNYDKADNVFTNGKCSVKIKGNSFEITEKVKIKSADEAVEWLAGKGFELKNTIKAEYRGEYVIRTVYKGKEVFGSRISVKCNGEESTAYGSFFYVVEGSESKAAVRHATSVLPKLIQEGISNCSVSSINLGYSVVSDESRFTEANANPTYRILLSDGREIFYNATK